MLLNTTQEPTSGAAALAAQRQRRTAGATAVEDGRDHVIRTEPRQAVPFLAVSNMEKSLRF